MTYKEFAEAWQRVLTVKPNVASCEIRGEFDGGWEDASHTLRWSSVHLRCSILTSLWDGGGVEYLARVTVSSSSAHICFNVGYGEEQIASTDATTLVEEFHRRLTEREAVRDSVRRLVVSNAGQGEAP